MKAEDLMIGDWVCVEVQVDDTGTEPVFETTPKRVTELTKGIYGIYVEGTSEYAGAEITPIPLTPEILEKNGWFLDEIDCGYRHPDLGFWIGGMSAPFGFLVSCIYKELYYVHELQHALKFCGIEKEIII